MSTPVTMATPISCVRALMGRWGLDSARLHFLGFWCCWVTAAVRRRGRLAGCRVIRCDVSRAGAPSGLCRSLSQVEVAALAGSCVSRETPIFSIGGPESALAVPTSEFDLIGLAVERVAIVGPLAAE